ncbi:hypothetical protein HanPSC8_Chr04g0178571 [Helianthus annuus]|nr:hypothetical protein HanPSC8_Chr04g0178571 [Helianthus annuus]
MYKALTIYTPRLPIYTFRVYLRCVLTYTQRIRLPLYAAYRAILSVYKPWISEPYQQSLHRK